MLLFKKMFHILSTFFPCLQLSPNNKNKKSSLYWLTSVTFLLFLIQTGVAFMKSLPEGTYDAVIVDSSDPIGELWRFITYSLCIFYFLAYGNPFWLNQVLLKNCLRSLFSNQWQERSVQGVLCAPKQRAYGCICTSSKILFLCAAKSSRAQ